MRKDVGKDMGMWGKVGRDVGVCLYVVLFIVVVLCNEINKLELAKKCGGGMGECMGRVWRCMWGSVLGCGGR